MRMMRGALVMLGVGVMEMERRVRRGGRWQGEGGCAVSK